MAARIAGPAADGGTEEGEQRTRIVVADTHAMWDETFFLTPVSGQGSLFVRVYDCKVR